MEAPKDLSEMLKAKKSKIKNSSALDLIQKFDGLTLDSNNTEEFPKLRKPKSATLLKLQQADRCKLYDLKPKSLPENITPKDNDHKADLKLTNVPLRQEFLNKKEEMEKATTKLLKKYELLKLSEQLYEGLDSNEPQPIALEDKFEQKGNEIDCIKRDKLNTLLQSKEHVSKAMTYNEYHIIMVLYVKIKAHPTGFFANNIPNWYENTFNKNLPVNWMDLLKMSNKFSLENINSKIVIYAIEENDKDDIDTQTSGDMDFNKNLSGTKVEPSGGFVRYKHLEKSLQNYKSSAGRDVLYTDTAKPIKLSDRLNKPHNVSKSNVRYKHLQGPWPNK